MVAQITRIRFWKLFLRAYLPAIVVLAGVGGYCHIKGIPIRALINDPLILLGAYPYVGFLSNLGALIWFGCVFICFFAAAFLAHATRDKQPALFLFWGGIITLFLGVDDFYALHESALPDLLHIHQFVLFGLYVLGTIAYLVWFRKLVFKSANLPLILACVFFASSIGFDILFEFIKLPWHAFYEDGSKFIGIVSWAAYFINYSYEEQIKATQR